MRPLKVHVIIVNFESAELTGEREESEGGGGGGGVRKRG